MYYKTTWYHLDKDNKVISEHRDKACFSSIREQYNFEKNCQYLLYDFSNMVVSTEEAYKYFLFLKSIPEFKELMPRNCKTMATSMKYKVDLHKFNGTKIFTMLTLIRAVVEDLKIVREVLSFDRKFKYSISNFSILKLCGSVHQLNSNHWITMTMSKDNLDLMFNTRTHWDSKSPCIKTGLGRNVHYTFNCPGDGYAAKNPVSGQDIARIKVEKDSPKKQTVRKVQYDTTSLQLGF